MKIPARRNPFDWIFILRPVLHPPVWTIVILGYFLSPVKYDSIYPLLQVLLLSSGLAGWAYILNQISDIDTDRRNNKLFYLSSGLISVRAALIYSTVLLILSLVLAFMMSYRVGIVSLILVALGYLYSGKPFYGKNRPVLGTLLNGIGHGSLGIVLGYLAAGGGTVRAVLLSVPYIFAVIAVYIGTTLPDIRGDSLSGKKTPGVVLGLKFAVPVMTLSLMTSLILALLFRDVPLMIACNLSMPFFIYAMIRPTVKNVVLAARISVLFLTLAACFLFPWYAPLILLLYVTSRIYYWKRFGIKYPSVAL